MSRLLKQFQYNKLPQDTSPDEAHVETTRPKGYHLTKSQIIILVTATATLSGSLTALVLYLLTPTSPPTTTHHHYTSAGPELATDVSYHFPAEPPRMKCGYNAEEAIALNCTYDPLSVAWLPSYCPLDHLDDFDAAAASDPVDRTQLTTTGKWRYFYDQKGENEMAGLGALARIGPTEQYWTTVSEHRWHCAFMLMRIHAALLRARKGDLVMDATTLSSRHAKHCIFWLAEKAKRPEDDTLLAHGQVAYGSC